MTRAVLAILTLLAFAVPTRAQEAGQSPQTEGAIADARESLRHQMLSAQIVRGVTVREFLEKTGSGGELAKLLNGAQQIGGTRWLDDQTAQVRLVIEGGAVADSLNQVVSRNPDKSPVPADELRKALADWKGRSFSATGTSTGPADMTRLAPPVGDVNWNSIAPAERNRALAAARENAVSRLVDSLRPIEISDGKTVGDALAVPDAGTVLNDWLASRPVTSVDFRDDLSVRVTLSAPTDELWQVLHNALTRQKQVAVPNTESGWSLLQKQVEARLAPAVGIGLVQVAKGGQGGPAVEHLIPDLAPAWANQQMQAEGTSPSRGSKLHTARAAEAIAMEKLRGQVEALKLRDNLTVGQAEKRDARVERAVAKGLAKARPYQVDYNQGSVTVKVTFNLSDVWTLMSERK